MGKFLNFQAKDFDNFFMMFLLQLLEILINIFLANLLFLFSHFFLCMVLKTPKERKTP